MNMAAPALIACAGCYSDLTIQNTREKAKILLDGGATSDIVNVGGDTVLHLATKQEIVRWFGCS